MQTKWVWLAAFSFVATLVHADVQVPDESAVILQKFQLDGRSLSEDYAKQLPTFVHEKVLRDEATFMNSLNGVCKETTRISFGGPLMSGDDAVAKGFEDGIIKIEASKCFQGTDPKELIEINTDTSFKKRAFGTLDKITSPSNTQNCEWTSAPTIGKSNYCYTTTDIERSVDVISQVSFLTYNNDGKGFEAPVYFRENFVSARKMGDKTLFYVQSYVRATALTSFKKMIAKHVISSSQDKFFEEMGKSINQKRTEP